MQNSVYFTIDRDNLPADWNRPTILKIVENVKDIVDVVTFLPKPMDEITITFNAKCREGSQEDVQNELNRITIVNWAWIPCEAEICVPYDENAVEIKVGDFIMYPMKSGGAAGEAKIGKGVVQKITEPKPRGYGYYTRSLKILSDKGVTETHKFPANCIVIEKE